MKDPQTVMINKQNLSILELFLKNEGKEVERETKKGMVGGGLSLNTFFGVEIFSSRDKKFSRGVKIFWGVEKFSGVG